MTCVLSSSEMFYLNAGEEKVLSVFSSFIFKFATCNVFFPVQKELGSILEVECADSQAFWLSGTSRSESEENDLQRVISSLRHLSVYPHANSFISDLIASLTSFEVKDTTFKINKEEEGAITISFRNKRQRLLFFIERNDGESGWTMVRHRDYGELFMNGSLESSSVDEALKAMFKKKTPLPWIMLENLGSLRFSLKTNT